MSRTHVRKCQKATIRVSLTYNATVSQYLTAHSVFLPNFRFIRIYFLVFIQLKHVIFRKVYEYTCKRPLLAQT